MNSKVSFLVVGVVLVVAVLIGVSYLVIKKGNTPFSGGTEIIKDKEDEVTCIREYDFDNNEKNNIRKQDLVVSKMFDNTYKQMKSDFNTKFEDGSYLLGITEELDDVFVNANYFSDFKIGNATVDNSDSVLGQYKNLAFDKQSPKEVLEFLLKSEMISTFIHLSSHVCLTEENDDADKYVAKFNASHDYCTNECVTDKYTFSVELNKSNGDIKLTSAKSK